MTRTYLTHRPFALLCCILACVWSAAASAIPIPAPPSLAAKSYILIDQHSGRVLAEQNADEKVEPASITKLMTSYVVFHALKDGAINMDDDVLVSEKASREPGSTMFLESGKKVTVSDLIKGMIIQSGNDASVALAEHVAGAESSFVDIMNQYAQRLDMSKTHFANATGLPDPDHYTSARDIVKLARALISEFPQYYPIFSEKDFTFNNIHQGNRNILLDRDDSVDGLKTGHTESAGYCLVASKKQGEMRLISAVFGTNSERARADASQALLNYGFSFFETHRLYQAGTQITDARVWKGDVEQVPVGLEGDLYVTIPRGRYKDLKALMDLKTTIIAPLSTDTQLGKVKVSLDDKSVASAGLVPLQPVAEGGLLHRMADAILLWFH